MQKFIFIIFLGLGLSLSAKDGINLSGDWLGTRYQYNYEKTAYMAEFDYEYHLKQEGNHITGTSIIKSKDGNFAKLSVRGFIEGNQLYFEEYEVINAQRAEDHLWCLKKGVLEISESNGKIELKGATPSFAEYYGFECTGGVTHLAKEKTELNTEEVQALADKEENHQVSVYPNPFVENTVLSIYNEKEQSVYIDVVDISGKVLRVLEDKVLDKGAYQYNFTPSSEQNSHYFYIRIKIGDKTITKSIQKFEGMGNNR